METQRDNPNVVAPPPLVFLSGLIVGAILAWLFPSPILPKSVSTVAGVLFALVGIFFIVLPIAQMRRARTNVEPWKPTTAIVDDGVYALSRNPIYLGMTLIYLGASFSFNSFWFLPPLALVLFVVHNGVIVREEKYLTRKFGDEYLNYKRRVRRWI